MPLAIYGQSHVPIFDWITTSQRRQIFGHHGWLNLQAGKICLYN